MPAKLERQITGPIVTGGVFGSQLQELFRGLELIRMELPSSRDDDDDHAVTRGRLHKLGQHIFKHPGDVGPFLRMVFEVVGLVQSLPGGTSIEIVGLHQQVIVVSRTVLSLLIDLQPMELSGRAADGTVSKERGFESRLFASQIGAPGRTGVDVLIAHLLQVDPIVLQHQIQEIITGIEADDQQVRLESLIEVAVDPKLLIG